MKSFHIFIMSLVFLSVSFASDNDSNNPVAFNPELMEQLKQYPLPENTEGKPPRFAFLKKLLDTSSGARQVKTSSNPEAHKVYIDARKIYINAAEESDNDVVNKLLNDTVKLMYQAIRLASPKKLTNKKKERDYKRKLLSVNALVEALSRVAVEKKNEDDTDKLTANINSILSNADGLVKRQKFDEARVLLDEAYLLVKTGIDNMRNGDVLVRDLNFATKEEEYSYELDRNETHQMLVKLLVEKKLESKPEAYKQKINERVEQAHEIRAQAEKLGGRGDFEEAIVELERSTKELIKAIRMGGIFIPG